MTLRTAFEAAAHRAGEAHKGLIWWDDVFADDEVGDALADFLAMGAKAGRVAERARIREAVEGLGADDTWASVDRAAVLALVEGDDR